MIKKLTLQDDSRILCGKDYMLALRYVQQTINQLVDAVNELTSCVGQLGVEFTDETHAENVPQPIKLYVCPDGSVYDNEDVAKSHAASMFNPLPAGATTTDRVYLERELNRTRKALDCAINTLDTVYGMSEDDGNIETYIKCKRIEINGIIKGGDNE